MSKNKIGYEKQAKMVAENIPQPFVFEYEDEKIEVNPVLSPAEIANATRIVTALAVGADSYYPEMEEFAIRFASMTALITNIRWDAKRIFERHYNQLMYTDIWDKFVNEMDKRGCAWVLEAIRGNAAKRIRHELDMQKQSMADVLIAELLNKASGWLDKAQESLSAEDLPKLMRAVQDAKELNQEDKLVAKILDYHAPDEEVILDDIGGGTAPVSGE